MKPRIHLLIVTTLSMIMTFLLHCALKNTRASGFIFQTTIIDFQHDFNLYLRCLADSEKMSCDFLASFKEYIKPPLILVIILRITLFLWSDRVKYTRYMDPVLYTIICAWWMGRFCDNLHLWYPADVFTVYLFIWQLMFIVVQWEYEKLPLLSVTIYRGWLCLKLASDVFFFHDTFFCYAPLLFKFCFFWTASITDIFACLHPDGYLNDIITNGEDSNNDLMELANEDVPNKPKYYYVCYIENSGIDQKKMYLSLGFGDFSIYNLMLLTILPCSSSLTTRACVTIGHIIAVQLSRVVAYRLARLCELSSHPAVPLPVMMVSIYAVLLNSFMA